MGLAAFNRMRRAKQIEEMKPENIEKKIDKKDEENIEHEPETKTSTRRNKK